MRRAPALVAAALVLCSPLDAHGVDTPGVGGSLNQDDGETSIEVDLTITDDGTIAVDATPDSSSPRLFRYVWTPALVWGGGLDDHLCDAGTGTIGWRHTVRRVAFTGAFVGEPETVCVALPDPDDTTVAPEPPALPEPPTIGEICQAAATANIPRPTIGVRPHVDGVTGLETWLWATGTDVVTINATATATAGP